MNRVLELALKVARENNARQVTQIDLAVGVMSGVIPRYARLFFEQIAQNTIASQARLVVEELPARFVCLDCGQELLSELPGTDFTCQHCGSMQLRLTAGREFHMKSVAVI
jgi:hydrogenase nickel incorporation protein HypA/HybF